MVELSDVFDPKGFIPKIGKAVLRRSATGVREILPSGMAFPVTDPAGHLACFTIKAAREKLPAVTIKNQFGHATLRIGQPKLLCLPTWQGQRKPPKPRSVQPPGLDHFTCYPVTKALGKYRVPRVGLKDAFARKAVHPHVKAVPDMLCATTLEIVGMRFSKVFHPGAYLTCFPLGKTPVKRKVFGLNQLGRAVVAIHKTSGVMPAVPFGTLRPPSA